MIPTSNKTLSFLIVLASLAVFACSPKIDRLEIVRIGNFRLDSITREYISLRAEIAIHNPYSSTAQLRDISVDFSVTDHNLIYGRINNSTELKGGATAVLDIPLAIRCNQVTEKDFEALFEKEIPYKITGTAVLEKPYGPRTLPIEVRGQLPAKQELQFSLSNKGGVQVIAADVSGMQELISLIRQRKLSMRFFNPLSFPLTIRNFNAELHLGKALIAEGESAESLRLNPGENHFSLQVKPHATGIAAEFIGSLLSKTLPDLTITSHFELIRKDDRSLGIQLIYLP